MAEEKVTLAIEAINKASKPLKEIQKDLDKTAKAGQQMGKKVTKHQDKLNKKLMEGDNVTKQLGSSLKSMIGIGAGIGIIATVVSNVIARLQEMNENLGKTRENLELIQQAGYQSGKAFGEIDESLKAIATNKAIEDWQRLNPIEQGFIKPLDTLDRRLAEVTSEFLGFNAKIADTKKALVAYQLSQQVTNNRLLEQSTVQGLLTELLQNQGKTISESTDILHKYVQAWDTSRMSVEEFISLMPKAESSYSNSVSNMGSLDKIMGKFTQSCRSATEALARLQGTWDTWTGKVDENKEAARQEEGIYGKTLGEEGFQTKSESKAAAAGVKAKRFQTKRRKKRIGFKQGGGFIPETGMYMMHAGERVTTSQTTNATNNMGGISINVSGAGDPQSVARAVMKEINRQSSVGLRGAIG